MKKLEITYFKMFVQSIIETNYSAVLFILVISVFEQSMYQNTEVKLALIDVIYLGKLTVSSPNLKKNKTSKREKNKCLCFCAYFVSLDIFILNKMIYKSCLFRLDLSNIIVKYEQRFGNLALHLILQNTFFHQYCLVQENKILKN